jgi:hypothetical protein
MSSSSSTTSATVRLSILHIPLLLVCIVGYLGGSAFAEDRGHENDGVAAKKTIECGIYLAPSSIPFAGLGMYVGNRSFEVNDIVTDEDIVVPIIEREWHADENEGKVRGIGAFPKQL